MGREVNMRRGKWGYYQSTCGYTRLSPGFDNLDNLWTWMYDNIGVTVDTHRGGRFASVAEVREAFEECARFYAPAAVAGKPHSPKGQGLAPKPKAGSKPATKKAKPPPAKKAKPSSKKQKVVDVPVLVD